MKPLIFNSPIEVTNKLDSIFGLSRDNLMEVVERMVAARNSCTENDPPSAPGWKSWCDGTRRLREVVRPLGWEKDEDGHISSVFDKARNIKIAVCNTDDGTGSKNSQPQNRSKKGAATDRAVSGNQLTFDSIFEGTTNVIQMSPQGLGGLVYWYLCVYCEGEIVRAEISCPSFCENGFFKGFRERIFLIGDDDTGDGVRRRTGPDDGSEFDIPVLRKKA